MRVVLTCFAVISLVGCDSKLTVQEQPKSDPRQRELALVKAKVAGNLKDPSSAQFRNVRRVPFLKMPEKDPWAFPGHYCGEVNGKNSYGAYSGFQTFYVFGPDSKGKFNNDSPVTINDPSDPFSNVMYSISCEDNGKSIEGIPVNFPI